MANNDLSCKELVELVTEYLDSALSPSERQRFEAHLAGCRGCRTYIAQLRQTIQAVGQLTEASIPEKTKQDLLETFRNWKQNK